MELQELIKIVKEHPNRIISEIPHFHFNTIKNEITDEDIDDNIKSISLGMFQIQNLEHLKLLIEKYDVIFTLNDENLFKKYYLSDNIKIYTIRFYGLNK